MFAGKRGDMGWLGKLPVLFRGLGAALVLLWAGFGAVSHGFAYGTESATRPFGPAALVVGAAFLFYLVAWWVAVVDRGRGIRLREVAFFAVLFRLPLLLYSHPVQEIDYFRYLWDGRVASEGISPFRFSPAEIDRYREQGPGAESEVVETAGVALTDLERLQSLLDAREPTDTIFRRIDHREVRTVYPVVAQAVFAAAAWVAPLGAPVFCQLVVLRGLITAFDLGVIGLLILLARRLELGAAPVIAWAWCPLVLKEFANTAHMDVIPVFFTVAAFVALGKSRRSGAALRCGVPSALFLVLAIFAKWYPVILGPLFLSMYWSRWRWRAALPLGAALVLAGGLAAITMMAHRNGAGDTVVSEGDPSGLRVFLTRWEMNDLVFSVVHENLRSGGGEESRSRPEVWYAVTPQSWREGWANLVGRIEARWGGGGVIGAPGFFGAQLFCGTLLAWVVARLSLRRWREGNADILEEGRALFLVLAASWYLSATQNPWYWAWALPFIGFARTRIWWLVSGFALIYYARFCLIYRVPEPFWRGYDGRRVFDEIVVWGQHLPILLALAIQRMRSRSVAVVGRCPNGGDRGSPESLQNPRE